MILEIRTYRLHPGTSGRFVTAMTERAIPLLAEFGIRVVACGASLVREGGHEEAYLIRSFDSLVAHKNQEIEFYASPRWHDGPRQDILSCIASYHSIVLDAESSGLTLQT